jgi:hypothetical protein
MSSTQRAHHELKAFSVTLIALGIGALELKGNELAYDTPRVTAYNSVSGLGQRA